MEKVLYCFDKSLQNISQKYARVYNIAVVFKYSHLNTPFDQ